MDGARFEETTALLRDTSGPADGLDVLFGNIWGAGFQPSWLDYDDDGDVDLLVINDFGQDIQPNVLWRNDGADGSGGWTFTDVSLDTGIDVPMYGMGLAVGRPKRRRPRRSVRHEHQEQRALLARHEHSDLRRYCRGI